MIAPGKEAIIRHGTQQRLHDSGHQDQPLNGVQLEPEQHPVHSGNQQRMQIASDAFGPFPRQVTVSGRTTINTLNSRNLLLRPEATPVSLTHPKAK